MAMKWHRTTERVPRLHARVLALLESGYMIVLVYTGKWTATGDRKKVRPPAYWMHLPKWPPEFSPVMQSRGDDSVNAPMTWKTISLLAGESNVGARPIIRTEQ